MSQEELAVAQKLVRDLRAELYTTRNAQKEAKGQSDSMRMQVSSLQNQLQQYRENAGNVQDLEKAVKEKQALIEKLLQDIKDLRTKSMRLENDLGQEKIKAEKAESSRDKAEAERIRLHRLREDTAHQLLAAKSRIQDLEEEQIRLEDSHNQQIAALTSGNEQETPKSPRLGSGFSVGVMSHQELDLERQRAEGLTIALETAMRERNQIQRQFQELQSQYTALSEKSETQKSDAEDKVSPEELLPKFPPTNTKSSEEAEELKQRINQLVAVRDKLMEELDLQVEETERLAVENASTTQAMLNARKISNAWEAQTNDSLMQIDKLKDMLEESGTWQSKLATGNQENMDGGKEANQKSEGQEIGAQATLKELEAQLVEAKSKATELDLLLRGLSAEYTRHCAVSEDLKNWNLPFLANVEKQLQSILKATASSVFTSPATS